MIKQQSLKLQENSPEYKLEPGDEPGTAKAKDRKEEWISQIIHRLNELFITDSCNWGQASKMSSLFSRQ